MAATLIRNVVVIGAGGSLGPAVLKAFDSHFVVTIISRQSSTSTFAAKYKVRIVEDDYPTAQLLEAFKNQDAVISLISPGTSQTQYHIIDAAVEAGVKRFIPADFGYDIANANAIALLPALQIRVDIINYLKAQEEKDMTWTNITTGPFFDWGLTNGFTGFDIPNRKAMIYDNGDQPFSTSTIMLIADAITKTLLRPEETRNRHIYVSSFTTTQNAILATLEKYTAEPWEATRVSSKGKITEGREMLKNGGDRREALRLLLLAVQYTAGNGSDFSGRDSNEVLDLPKENMDDVIKHFLGVQ